MSSPPGSTSDSQRYASHVREILDRVADLEAQVQDHRTAPRGSPLTRAPIVAVIALIFGAVVAWDVFTLTRKPEPLPPSAAQSSLQVSVMVVTQAVEAYREAHGTLPASMDELGLPPGAEGVLQYRRRGENFDVTGAMGPTRVRFRSEEGPLSLLKQLGPPDGGAP